jgi:prepilin-type N-terminal cleavage/methylation domain-containing protein
LRRPITALSKKTYIDYSQSIVVRQNYTRGFSIIELLLVVVVLGILGLAGWYVWQSNGKANKKP